MVRGVSFTVKSNESMAIIGPNGCGKTTLLKILAGLLPFRGVVEYDGKPINAMRQREVAQKVALLSQMTELYFSYTVFDTVMMGRYHHVKGSILGLTTDEDRVFVENCLDAVGLLSDKDREITKLSGGQLQRVFLARTLAQDPELIMLDEPTNHLDLKYQLELIEYLKDWMKTGTRAVIGILHDITLAARLGENILIMKSGETQAIGKTSEIFTASILERVYETNIALHMKNSLKMWEGL